jgi:hypothetical protein
VPELGKSLDELHVTEVGRLNWFVHGSGVAILEHTPSASFFLVCALGLYTSSVLAELISAFTMKTLPFGRAHKDITVERIHLNNERRLALFEQLNETLSAE